MPVYRCNKCGHVSESPVAGTQIKCSACQHVCNVYDTAFFITKLLERYSAALREVKALQIQERGDLESVPTVAESDSQEELESGNNSDNLATEAQHAPLEKWLKGRQIEAQFDHSNVDTSGYFDEAAQQLGRRHDLFGELLQRVSYAYRKSHTGLNLDLSTLSQKDAQAINTLCRELYSHTLFARYFYQKQEKVVRLTLQPAPKVRQFFDGIWLEWYALLELLDVLQRRKLQFSCARGVNVLFQNEDIHELDVIALPAGQAPICIECKAGEFRRDIDKYQRLRKRLGIERNRFIVCSTDINDEQASSLTAMYDLTFVNLQTLSIHLNSIV
jgi:hypothetical protein